MRGMPDAELHDLAATVAVARLVLGPEGPHPGPAQPHRRRVRPAAAGRHRRLGRRLAGHPRPRQPGAAVAADRRAGPALRRGRVHAAGAAHHLPGVRARRPSRGSTPGWPPHVAALADPADRAGRRVGAAGRPALAGAGRRPTGSGRIDLHATIDTDRPHRDRRGDFDIVYGDWSDVGGRPSAESGTGAGDRPRVRRCAAGLRLAADDPAALLTPRHEAAALALFEADGPALDELCRIADDLRARRGRRRRHLRGQPQHQLLQRLLRRLPVLRVRPAGARRRRVPAVGRRRSPTGPRRRGRPARPRSACRAASTRSCRSPPTPSWSAR